MLIFFFIQFLSIASQECNDFISCELLSFVLDVPNHCEDSDIGNVCLNNVKCGSISINHVPTSYTEASKIDIGINNLKATCIGEWHLNKVMNGDFTASVYDTFANMSMVVNKQPLNIYPNELTFTDCDVTHTKINVDLRNASSRVNSNWKFMSDLYLKDINGIAERIAIRMMKQLLCENMLTKLSTNITNWLVETLDPTLVEMSVVIPTDYPVIKDPVTLTDNPIVLDWNQFENTNLWHYLDGNYRYCVGSAVGYSFLSFINDITDDTGNFTLPIDKMNDLPLIVEIQDILMEKLQVSFDLEFLQISGLNTFKTGGDDFEPMLSFPNSDKSNATLAGTMKFDDLSISIGFRVKAKDHYNNSYMSPLTMTMHFEDPTIEVELFLAMNQSSVFGLYLDQLTDIGCLYNSLLYPFNISQLSLQSSAYQLYFDNKPYVLTNSSSTDVGMLEVDLMVGVNNVMALVLGEYTQVVNNVLQGIMQGEVRNTLNLRIHEWVDNFVRESGNGIGGTGTNDLLCRNHTKSTSKYIVEWTTSKFISYVDTLINEYIGDLGLNRLINCVTNNTGVMHVDFQRGLSDMSDLPALLNGGSEAQTLLNLLSTAFTTGYSSLLTSNKPPINVSSTSVTSFQELDAGSTNLDHSHISLELGGLNSVYNLTLLEPLNRSPYELGNSIGLGACNETKEQQHFHFNNSQQDTDQMLYHCNDEAFVPFYVVLTLHGIESNKHASDTVGSYDQNSDGNVNIFDNNHTSLRTSSLSIKLTASNLYLYLDILAKIDINTFMDLSVSQLLSPGCMMTSAEDLAVNALIIDRYNGTLEISVQHDNSHQPDVLVFKELNNELIYHLLLKAGAGDTINENIQTNMANSEELCMTGMISSNEDAVDEPWIVHSWEYDYIYASIGLLGLLVVGYQVHSYSKYQHFQDDDISHISKGSNLSQSQSEFDLTINTGNDELLTALREENKDICTELPGNVSEKAGENIEINGSDGSLWSQIQYVPMAICYALPFALLLNFYIFVDADLMISSSVKSKLALDGEVVEDYGSFFDFTLKITVQDMWWSGAYLLSSLVAFFSGGFPFVKLIVTWLCWCLPTIYLSSNLREELLFWFDMFGKWAVACTLVDLLLTVGFHITMPVGDSAYSVIISVKPGWGTYSFLLGTLMSMILGHVALYYHRKVVHNLDNKNYVSRKISFPNSKDFKRVSSLEKHTFNIDKHIYSAHNGARSFFSHNKPRDRTISNANTLKSANEITTSRYVTVTPLGAKVFRRLLVFTFCCVVTSACIAIFDFRYEGLIGYFMGDNNTQPFSLLTLAWRIPHATALEGHIEVILLMCFLMAICILCPLLLLATCLYLLMVPLTIDGMISVLFYIEILHIWSCLDVMLVAIVSTTFDIHIFGEFIIGSKCDGVNEILAQTFDEELHGDDVCFDIRADLLWVSRHEYCMYMLTVCV